MIANAPGHVLLPDAPAAIATDLCELGSPRLRGEPEEPGVPFLRVGPRLELWLAGDPPRGPLGVDPTAGALGRRLRTFDRGNLLARAVGLHRGVRAVFDATAGLGGDGLCLAALGARVTLVEREPALALLLEVARRRLLASAERLRAIGERVHVDAGCAIARLEALAGDPAGPEVVTLDPMYPPRRKDALPRQEMVLLHAWIGPTVDVGALLRAARAAATRHVVVKRPLAAEPLEPDVLRVYRSKMVRFDVYAPRPRDPR